VAHEQRGADGTVRPDDGRSVPSGRAGTEAQALAHQRGAVEVDREAGLDGAGGLVTRGAVGTSGDDPGTAAGHLVGHQTGPGDHPRRATR